MTLPGLPGQGREDPRRTEEIERGKNEAEKMQAAARKAARATEKPVNSVRRWAPAEVKRLKELADQNTPISEIGMELNRSEQAIRAKAKREGISLRPTNRSPYIKKK